MALFTGSGLYANRPSEPKNGFLYFCTDSCIWLQYRRGTGYVSMNHMFPCTEPPTTGWSWVNQGTASVDSSSGVLRLSKTNSGTTTDVSAYVRSVPATPYTITVGLMVNYPYKNFLSGGLVWRQSSDGKLVTIEFRDLGIQVFKFTNPTTYSASYAYQVLPQYPMWLQITDNGTNRIIRYSEDGFNFRQVHSVSRTDFLTANQVGITISSVNEVTPNLNSSLTVFSWKVT